jgi:hypothetical protein
MRGKKIGSSLLIRRGDAEKLGMSDGRIEITYVA